MYFESKWHEAGNANGYQQQMDAILERSVTADTIGKFADLVLHDLVNTVTDVRDDYLARPTLGFEHPIEIETAASSYFNLPNIDMVLDRLADKALEIRLLDSVIDHAERLDIVIVPPDLSQGIRPGKGGGFEPKQLIPRLKTALFVLANEFELDIENKDQLEIISGVVTDKMVRDESYYLVDVPSLQRKLLICDEEGNVSYVFDSAQLKQEGIMKEQLLGLSKLILNDFLQAHPTAGQRIIYNKNFVSNLLQAINEPRTTVLGSDIPKSTTERSVTFHVSAEPAPEGYISVNSYRTSLGLAQEPVERAIRELKKTGQLPEEDIRFKFEGSNMISRGLSPTEQSMVYEWLDQHHVFAGAAPETHLSIEGFSLWSGMSPKHIANAITDLKESGVIDTDTYHKFGSYPTRSLSPEDQNAVFDWLHAHDKFVIRAPAENQSAAAIARYYGITPTTVARAIRNLQTRKELPELRRMSHGTHPTTSLDPWQQNIVHSELQATGAFATIAPEDYLSFSSLLPVFRVSPKTLQRAIDELAENGDFGTVDYHKFGSRVAVGYSPEHQATIFNHLEKSNRVASTPSVDALSLYGFSQESGVARSTLQKVIEDIDPGTFGKVESRQFNNGVYASYTTEQRQLVIDVLAARGTFNKIPKDFATAGGFANRIERDRGTVINIVQRLQESGVIGEVGQYWSTNTVTDCYSPEQQSLIEAESRRMPRFSPEVTLSALPEDYLTIVGIGKISKASLKLVTTALKAIDPEALGAIDRFQVEETSQRGFSPTQQQLIMTQIENLKPILPDKPHDFMTVSEVRHKAQVGFDDLYEAVNSIDPEFFGGINKYNTIGGRSINCYTPHQIRLILNKVARQRVAKGNADESELSFVGLARALGMAEKTVSQIVEELGEKIGPIDSKKFRTKTTKALSADQQAMIMEHAIQTQRIVAKAPEGFLSKKGVSDMLGIHYNLVRSAVEELDSDGSLGEEQLYSFEKAPRPYRGYSPAQQQIISQWLTEHGKLG